MFLSYQCYDLIDLYITHPLLAHFIGSIKQALVVLVHVVGSGGGYYKLYSTFKMKAEAIKSLTVN